MLRELRKAKNLSQQQLADMVGVDRSIISHYESKNIVPRISVFKKLCHALDLNYEEQAKLLDEIA